MARGRPKSELSLLERLLNKVVINDVTDCWEYQGGKNNIGYGMIRDENKMRTTHRVSYEEHNGKIPAGLCVLHKCDNPKCCNPNHLWLGTHQQNSDDMISKGRHNISGSYGMTGKTQPRTTCIHCNQSMPNNTYARFHGDKCKKKQSINTL